jgi:hypothetical protein
MHTVTAGTKPGIVYGFSILVAIGAGAALQAGYSSLLLSRKETCSRCNWIHQHGSTRRDHHCPHDSGTSLPILCIQKC